MRRVSFVVLILAISPSAFAADRVDDWINDLQSLETQLSNVHPRYKQCGLPPELRNDFARLIQRLGSLSDSEITVETQRILASVGDGHTLLFPFGMKRGTLRRLPLMLWQFDDGLYVVRAATPEAVGRRVVRIGSLTTEDVAKRLEKYISHDNEMQLRWAIPFYATLTDLLAAIGATTSRDAVTLGFDRGEPVTFSSGEIDPATLEIKLPPPANEPLPAYLQHRNSNFWYANLPDGALYVQVNAIEDAPEESLSSFGMKLRPLLANTDRLVLDLRFNSGGEARKANDLLKSLVWFDASAGRIAVLTSRMTFSAAQTLATRLDEWTDAIFVGEATGSRPNHYGNERPFKLAASGLKGTIASGLNQPVTANDERTTIQPEIPVETRAADYFRGADTTLETALKALQPKAKN